QGMAPMPVNFFGQHILQNVPVEIDEKLLTEIAKLTGGQYFRATDTDSLRNIYEQIDKLEKQAVETVKYEEWREAFAWFALPGMSCLMLGLLLENTRLRRLP